MGIHMIGMGNREPENGRLWLGGQIMVSGEVGFSRPKMRVDHRETS